jgi:hypothetical protein
MKYSKWYLVMYLGRKRLSTVSQQEAEDYGRALWMRDGHLGEPPYIEEHDVR